MNPERASRSVSVPSVFTGTSMMRSPIASFSPASSVRNMPPAIRVFGTVAVSTTLIHGVHFIAPKYSAAAFTSWSVMALANAIIAFVLAFRASALFLAPLLKSAIVCTKYATGRPETPAFSGRPLPLG